MVLIRKHYFVQHLESLNRRQRRRTQIEQRLVGFVKRNGRSRSPGDKIQISVERPTPGNTVYNPTDRINAADGIGAALVGGGSAGIGLGIVLASTAPNANDRVASAETTAPGHTDEDPEVQSPKSITASFEWVNQEDGRAGIIADAHSFTSSPRSGVTPLPMSPGERPAVRSVYTSALSPRSIHTRRGL